MEFDMLSEINIKSIFGYELITGNALWRFGLVLLGILVTSSIFACESPIATRKSGGFPC